LNMFLSGSWGQQFLSGKALPLNQFAHVALVGNGATLRLFVDGQAAPNTAAQSLMGTNPPGPLYVGRGGDGYFSGWFGGVRVSNVCRYTADFTPPQSYASVEVPFVALPLHICTDSAGVAASSAVGTVCVGVPFTLTTARDTENGGNGTVYGTVARKGSPANTPLRRKVRLHNDITGALVRETWSDAATGAFTFTGLDPLQRYTTLAYDYAHAFCAEAADNLTPEVQP
jgi:hypothetical protein